MNDSRPMGAVLAALRDIEQGVADPAARARQALRDFVALIDEHAEPANFGMRPDLNDAGHALAHRVQQALTREFDGEELFPCVVVVEEPVQRSIGIAATAVPLEGVDQLLMLGRGAVRRVIRQSSDGDGASRGR
jgi:hypothetical protein